MIHFRIDLNLIESSLVCTINLWFFFTERGSRGWAVPLVVSVLRSPRRLRVSPDGTSRQEERRRGRSGPHFIIFIYTIQSCSKTYNMADSNTPLRRDDHRHHHCELFINGDGPQASIKRQNTAFKRAGKTTSYLALTHWNRITIYLERSK